MEYRIIKSTRLLINAVNLNYDPFINHYDISSINKVKSIVKDALCNLYMVIKVGRLLTRIIKLINFSLAYIFKCFLVTASSVNICINLILLVDQDVQHTAAFSVILNSSYIHDCPVFSSSHSVHRIFFSFGRTFTPNNSIDSFLLFFEAVMNEKIWLSIILNIYISSITVNFLNHRNPTNYFF